MRSKKKMAIAASDALSLKDAAAFVLHSDRKEIKKAGNRVGHTREQQLKWALDLANLRDTSDWSAGRLIDLKSEISAFHGSKWVPTSQEVMKIHKKFISLLNRSEGMDPVDDCTTKLMKLLGKFCDRLHRCPAEHGCGRWFLSQRIDSIYCSNTCSARKRARAFRQRKAAK
jgi:hypothetical protein